VFIPVKHFLSNLLFASTAGTNPIGAPSRVGSWPYLQILDQARGNQHASLFARSINDGDKTFNGIDNRSGPSPDTSPSASTPVDTSANTSVVVSVVNVARHDVRTTRRKSVDRIRARQYRTGADVK
jgi:hypothetical protein